VNDEINSLIQSLREAKKLLVPRGRMCVISYHSLEDRISKNLAKKSSDLKNVNKKVIVPSAEEIERNPRSRSAKLRVFEKNK
jgi:16S rRNA (cytosine1402-N4)-methyltransferase